MNEQKETAKQTASVTMLELVGLDNCQVALKLYDLINDKPLDDLLEIGEYLKIVAINKKG
ncbi:hypothetical protein [Brevibacillus porteri]|uniref:Uncharacterized protein n=1 Tax=Brevibacillus porteri TaxID=2126350 RepID=A0ABX5FGV2_9BACL|nr:hypothetical protein [Brevibacillus porteri]MED1803019.1 hypothetical protein [Brevibacillus porteri]MED2135127.1 hypothetical protein [Brevibacillus porteri]MED2745769.1 hypothetical protein [Brevibacillus porteri]MED2813767.1 hypothetical protein [Brevibacillus porteri]MED2897775.1 hypothetical protein [Brevibacillus porteri]